MLTAMDVFSRYLFAYPTSNQDAKTNAEVLINIMTKHAYLPTNLITDKSTAVMSHVIKDVASVLGFTLKHATTKHAQTIGLFERSHASIKQLLKIRTGERRSLWHRYVSIAVLNYNTSYHARIGCEPSIVFHGRIPCNILHLKMGIHPYKIPYSDSQMAQDVLEQTELFSKMSTKLPCKLTSNTKRIRIKKQCFKTQTSRLRFTSYSQKWITTEASFPLQIFGGLDYILLKRCYRTIFIKSAKLAPIRRKHFIK